MWLIGARLVLTAAAIGVLLPVVPHAQRGGKPDPDTPAIGKVLVASKGLTDPNFVSAVVVLFQVQKDGAAGLIVNRRTDLPLGKLLPSLAQGKTSEVLAFSGGPVAPSNVFALVRTGRPGSQRVLADLYLVNSREALQDVLAADLRADQLRAYLGYAGWGEGQLDREIAAGAWHVLDGSASVVFDPDPDAVWEKQLQRTVTRFASAQNLHFATAP